MKPVPAAPRADRAKSKCAASRRRFSQMAKWIATSVKHTADAIDQTTVIQLMESNGLRKWQEADRWHGANCYAGIPSHGPAIFTRFCLWGKSYLRTGRASYSVSQSSLANWRNSIFGIGLAVTGGLDQRGKQREPEGPAEISRCAQVTGLDMRKSDEPRKGRWIHARCFSPCPAGFLYYIVHSIKMGSARPLYDRRGKSRSGKPSAFGGPITRTPASRCWLMI